MTQELTFSQKIRNVARALREADQHYEKICGQLVGDETGQFCAMGVLGFKAEVPIGQMKRLDTIGSVNYKQIWKKYGFTDEELETRHKYKNKYQRVNESSFADLLYEMNDTSDMSFTDIAKKLEKIADKEEKKATA